MNKAHEALSDGGLVFISLKHPLRTQRLPKKMNSEYAPIGTIANKIYTKLQRVLLFLKRQYKR